LNCLHHRAESRKPDRCRAQQGVVLIVALVMLIVISLMAVSAMRGALVADLIAGNARAQTLAEQSAEVALRYCERQVQLNAPGFVQAPSAPAGSTHWNTFGKWFGAGKLAVTVPATVLASNQSSFTAGKVPECLAERTLLADGATSTILVTARGFRPDYSEDEKGRSISGSAVWLQSTLYVE
jgi:type IV pilus assembly protein PilX